jgi:hypothetical protein
LHINNTFLKYLTESQTGEFLEKYGLLDEAMLAIDATSRASK